MYQLQEDFEILYKRLGNGNCADLSFADLWLIEGTLNENEWECYLWAFATPLERRKKIFCWERGSALLHATIEEKVQALASAIRNAK